MPVSKSACMNLRWALLFATVFAWLLSRAAVSGMPFPFGMSDDEDDTSPDFGDDDDERDCGSGGCGGYDEYENYEDLGLVAGSCELQGCWDLYQSAQVALGLRDEYSSRDRTPSTEELRNRCLALRTFLQCIRNMTRCKGDLSFHSAHRGIERQMKQFNCSMTGPVFSASSHRPADGDGGGYHPTVCSYRGEAAHRHCGLFGDPHLRTFGNDFQTCKVQGAWPLLDNDYLTVQVTNDPVGLWEGTATATSKLTVVIKRQDECAADRFLTYQAQTDSLPATFDDGRSHVGPDKSVKITEVDAGRHVEIYLRYIDTTLIVRQIGRYFTFAIKMPEDLIEESIRKDPDTMQLCVKGCPLSERINYKHFLAHKHSRLKMKNALEQTTTRVAMTRDAAEALCREASVVDFYFDSCVFDLMTTGDSNFTLAASNALMDVLRLYPQAARMHENRTNLDDIDKEYVSSAQSVNFHRTHRTAIQARITQCIGVLFCLLFTSWSSRLSV